MLCCGGERGGVSAGGATHRLHVHGQGGAWDQAAQAGVQACAAWAATVTALTAVAQRIMGAAYRGRVFTGAPAAAARAPHLP